MPHIIVKVATGKSAQQKTRLVEAIVNEVMSQWNTSEESISVGVEEIPPEDWTEKVYEPDIRRKWETLEKKPGYDPLKK